MMCHVLIVDDDARMNEAVQETLTEESYTVTAVHSAKHAMEIIHDDDYDLFIINFDMKEDNVYTGRELCHLIRLIDQYKNAPVICLTHQDNVQERIQAFDYGADDYLVKPINLRELKARVRAHLRHVIANQPEKSLLHINPENFLVRVDQREVVLTPIEFELLYFMAYRSNQWLSTQELLTGVWDYPDHTGNDALVRNHIRNLRRKVELDPNHPRIIQSRHGRGYKVAATVHI